MPPQFSCGRKRDSLWCEGQMLCSTTKLRSHSSTGKKILSSSDSLWKQRRSTTHRKDVISLSVFFPQVQPHGLNIFLACNTVNTPRLTKHVRSAQYLVSCAETHESDREVSKTTWPKNTSQSGTLSNSSVVVISSLTLVVEPECTAPAWDSVPWAWKQRNEINVHL